MLLLYSAKGTSAMPLSDPTMDILSIENLRLLSLNTYAESFGLPLPFILLCIYFRNVIYSVAAKWAENKITRMD